MIRTPSAPWGLNELRIGKLQQVSLGTLLLRFSFGCMAALHLRYTEALVFFAHPKDDGDEKTFQHMATSCIASDRSVARGEIAPPLNVDHSALPNLPSSFFDLCYIRMRDHEFGKFLGED